MSTSYPDLWNALAAEFHPGDVKSRSQAGRTFSYITARTAMNRLDDVLGFENWWDDYVPGENSVLCRLTIRLADGSTITKADAGGYAGMADQGDDDKSGFSDAFKRAAVKFGVGRYLYRDGVPFATDPHVNGEVPNAPPAPRNADPQAKPTRKPDGPKHPNKSGFATGEYASPQQIDTYLARLRDKVQAANGDWADHWQDPKTGEIPAPASKPFLNEYQADGHLVKWAVESGQIDQDALDKVGKPSYLGKHVAILVHRDEMTARAVKNELASYIARTFEAKRDAIYRKHPELSPGGWLEEQQEAVAVGAHASDDAFEEGRE